MKKYVPSGYQIINLDCSALTSGDEIPSSTDSDLLKEILLAETKIHKPILLTVKTPNGYMNGIGVHYQNYISLTMGNVGSSVTVSIFIDGDGKLIYQYDEE